MAAEPVTPIAGLTDEVVDAGTPVIVIAGGPNGGFITNPSDAPGILYIDPVGSAGTEARGTTFALAPGQSWSVIAGQTTTTSVNSEIAGHAFSVVSW